MSTNSDSLSGLLTSLILSRVSGASEDGEGCGVEGCDCGMSGSLTEFLGSLTTDIPTPRGSGISSVSFEEGAEYFFDLPGVGNVDDVTVEILPPSANRNSHSIKVKADNTRNHCDIPYKFRYSTDIPLILDPTTASVTLQHGLLHVKFGNRELPNVPSEPIRVPVSAVNPADD